MTDLSRRKPNGSPDLHELVEQLRPVMDFAIDMFALVRAERHDLPRIYEALVTKYVRSR